MIISKQDLNKYKDGVDMISNSGERQYFFMKEEVTRYEFVLQRDIVVDHNDKIFKIYSEAKTVPLVQLKSVAETTFGAVFPDFHFYATISTTHEQTTIQRINYTLLQFLGDVGALFGTFEFIFRQVLIYLC